MKNQPLPRFLLALLCFSPAFTYGWSITPTLVTLTPEKPQTFFTVVADKDEKPVTVEIYAVPRLIDSDGVESYGERAKEFTIYPAQVILKAGETRRVRVIWKGNKQKIDTEKAYRLVASSLPVEIPTKTPEGNDVGVNIAIGTCYYNSVYVCPKNAVSQVKCSDVRFEKGENDKTMAVITLENKGTAHEYLKSFSVSLQGTITKIEIPTEEVKKACETGVNLLAGGTRILRLPIQSAPPTEKNISATILLNAQ